MTDAPPPRGIRLSDAERHQAAERLQRAMSEGRITLSEFEERTAAAYAATYASDLEPLFADLPPETTGWRADGGAEPVPVTPASPQTGAPAGLRPAIAGGLDLSGVTFPPEPVVIDAGWSTVRRKDQWLVPGWLRLKVGPGAIVLDCRAATFAQQITAVEVEVGMGTVRFIVPDGVTADVNAVTVGLGSAASRVPALPSAGHPHLIVSGRVGAGALVIRHAFF